MHQKNVKLVIIVIKCEPYLCNGCHGLMKKAIRFNDTAIIYVKGSAYRIHFWYMSKEQNERFITFFIIYKK